jgi:phage shock protein E
VHGNKKIKMKTLKEAIRDKNSAYIDVRTKSEYDSGHISGSLHVPLDELIARMDELRKISGPLILYCRSGNRSGMALHYLQEEGFTDLVNGGGFDDLRYLIG